MSFKHNAQSKTSNPRLNFFLIFKSKAYYQNTECKPILLQQIYSDTLRKPNIFKPLYPLKAHILSNFLTAMQYIPQKGLKTGRP